MKLLENSEKKRKKAIQKFAMLALVVDIMLAFCFSLVFHVIFQRTIQMKPFFLTALSFFLLEGVPDFLVWVAIYREGVISWFDKIALCLILLLAGSISSQGLAFLIPPSFLFLVFPAFIVSFAILRSLNKLLLQRYG